MKNKIHTARVPLYDVNFAWSNSIDELDKRFDLNPNSGDTFEDYCGFVALRHGTIVMWLPHDADFSVSIPVLCHESFHAAIMACQMIGIAISADNDEPAAYLAEWFSAKVLDFVNKEYKSHGQQKAELNN